MKNFFSLLLAIILAAGVFSAPTYAAGQGSNAGVSELMRTFDGYVESALRVVLTKLTFGYGNYEKLCKIPELDSNYVPQGYCLSAEGDKYYISYIIHSEIDEL